MFISRIQKILSIGLAYERYRIDLFSSYKKSPMYFLHGLLILRKHFYLSYFDNDVSVIYECSRHRRRAKKHRRYWSIGLVLKFSSVRSCFLVDFFKSETVLFVFESDLHGPLKNLFSYFFQSDNAIIESIILLLILPT